MLAVSGLCTEYANDQGGIVRAVRDASFEVPEGRLFTLLGPSGCGKTTTLRSIAGLEKPRVGEIVVAGRAVFSAERRIFVPPNRRGFGMVFQSYAIWPHMTVFQNAAFPLQVSGKKLGKREVDKRVMRVLATVALDALAERPATKLSGGEQQRLALARALVMEPTLLLLDEPLSNLDAKLRERMRFELKRLQRELGITTVYVTHDQSEALSLSHAIGVMKDGELLQIGTPREIYERPKNRFVADFVGTTNFLSGRVVRPDSGAGYFQVQSELGQVKAYCGELLAVDDEVTLSVRPEDIELREAIPQGENVWEGRVDQKIFLGEVVDFQVRVGDRILLSRAQPSLRTPVGERIFCQIQPDKCVALKAADETKS